MQIKIKECYSTEGMKTNKIFFFRREQKSIAIVTMMTEVFPETGFIYLNVHVGWRTLHLMGPPEDNSVTPVMTDFCSKRSWLNARIPMARLHVCQNFEQKLGPVLCPGRRSK